MNFPFSPLPRSPILLLVFTLPKPALFSESKMAVALKDSALLYMKTKAFLVKWITTVTRLLYYALYGIVP